MLPSRPAPRRGHCGCTARLVPWSRRSVISAEQLAARRVRCRGRRALDDADGGGDAAGDLRQVGTAGRGAREGGYRRTQPRSPGGQAPDPVALRPEMANKVQESSRVACRTARSYADDRVHVGGSLARQNGRLFGSQPIGS